MAALAEWRLKIQRLLVTVRTFSEQLIMTLNWPNLSEKTRLLLKNIFHWLQHLLFTLQSKCLQYFFPQFSQEPESPTDQDESSIKKSFLTAPPPDLNIPWDGLIGKERVKLLEGVHALLNQVPELRGYKLEKSKYRGQHTLKDYAKLFTTEEAKAAFIARYGDIALPFSIEISNDGHFFRVLPRRVYYAEGNDVVVKAAISLEPHPNLLFQANTVFARKRVVLPESNLKKVPRLMRLKEEHDKVSHLVPGYATIASPFQLNPERDDEIVRIEGVYEANERDEIPEGPREKCPGMRIGRFHKSSLIMPFAPGTELFDWWKESQTDMLRRSLKFRPTEALVSKGYRFRKYTPLILASILIALENFRLEKADEEWVHRDLKPENIMLWMSRTDPVQIVTTLIDLADAENIAPMSEGVSDRIAGTRSYMGREIYTCLRERSLSPVSAKTDSYAIGVALLLLCFDNFYCLMENKSDNQIMLKDIPDLIKNCISYDRFLFDDRTEKVYYVRPADNYPVLLRPILPINSPDYQALYQKVKAIAPMVDNDPRKRPLAIDVLKAAFKPEAEYLVHHDPALQNTAAVRALFDTAQVAFVHGNEAESIRGCERPRF